MLNRVVLRAALAAALIALMSGGQSSAAGTRIAVLISGPGAPYEQALAGMKQHIERAGVQADYAVLPLGGDAARAAQAVQELKGSRPGAIVTLGSLATDAAVKEIHDIPIVAAMVLRPDILKKAANATGVVLEFPAETQLQWIKKVLPRAHAVGVVFNPDENRDEVDRAARAAQKLGLTLVPQGITMPKDLPAALEKLAGAADALWGIADSTALNPQTARLILLFSFRNRMPFAGPSAAWVKAGALFALDWDYADLGAQCGELLQKVLQGAAPSSLPPVRPRKALLAVNRKTADDIGVQVPDEVLRGAATVY